MDRRALIAVWIIGSTLAILLTSWTFVRYLDSHRASRHFHLDLAAVESHDDPRKFTAQIVFRNEGDIRADIESLVVTLRWEGKGLATYAFPVQTMSVPPGEDLPLTVELESRLSPEDLPSSPDPDDERWSVTARVSLGHPVREGTIRLNLEGRTRSP